MYDLDAVLLDGASLHSDPEQVPPLYFWGALLEGRAPFPLIRTMVRRDLSPVLPMGEKVRAPGRPAAPPSARPRRSQPAPAGNPAAGVPAKMYP
jgi:hypothetical protein